MLLLASAAGATGGWWLSRFARLAGAASAAGSLAARLADALDEPGACTSFVSLSISAWSAGKEAKSFCWYASNFFASAALSCAASALLLASPPSSSSELLSELLPLSSTMAIGVAFVMPAAFCARPAAKPRGKPRGKPRAAASHERSERRRGRRS